MAAGQTAEKPDGCPDVVVRYPTLQVGEAGEHLGFALALGVTIGPFAVAAAGLCWLLAAVLTPGLVDALGAGLSTGVAVALLVATERAATEATPWRATGSGAGGTARAR